MQPTLRRFPVHSELHIGDAKIPGGVLRKNHVNAKGENEEQEGSTNDFEFGFH
jgi:hypothetical protein